MIIRKSVLIIDDEEDIREICKHFLGEICSKIFLAENAIGGLEILKKHNIDVVIVDVNMPKMSGFDFIDIAKRKYPKIKFLVISSNASIPNLHQSIRTGVSDFIEKPFSRMTFLEKVGNACREEVHIYAAHSLKSVIGAMSREQAVQQKALLIELREEVFLKFKSANGNIDVLRFDLEQMFELKINTEKNGLCYCLTPTESKISEMIDAGFSALAIARKMDRSINTIQVHIRSIRRKLGLVKTNESAIAEHS